MKEVRVVKVMKVKKERLTQVFIYILGVQGTSAEAEGLACNHGAKRCQRGINYVMGICGDHLFRIYLKE